jgi:regulator of cell morphogenesis and NO signaling
MTNLATRTIGELASEVPGATRLFEKLGIDYCCGGGRSLEAACSSAGLSLEEVSLSLEQAKEIEKEPKSYKDWRQRRLSELISHIMATHHVFTREELARLNPLFDKVCSVHGQNHPELLTIYRSFRALSQELTLHMQKEEQVLFPYILRMEQEALAHRAVPSPPFGTVQNPVRMMMKEHDQAGDVLTQIRKGASNFTVPADGCGSFRSLYQSLAGLEEDLHQHIHLENNLLFPRAIEMEGSARNRA